MALEGELGLRFAGIAAEPADRGDRLHGVRQQRLHAFDARGLDRMADRLVEIPAEEQLRAAPRDANMRRDVRHADLVGGVQSDEVQRGQRSGVERVRAVERRNALDNALHTVALANGNGVGASAGHQPIERLRRLVACGLEVRLDAGERRRGVFAEDLVVVAAEDGQIARDADPGDAADVENRHRPAVVGGKHRGLGRQRLQPVRGEPLIIRPAKMRIRLGIALGDENGAVEPALAEARLEMHPAILRPDSAGEVADIGEMGEAAGDQVVGGGIRDRARVADHLVRIDEVRGELAGVAVERHDRDPEVDVVRLLGDEADDHPVGGATLDIGERAGQVGIVDDVEVPRRMHLDVAENPAQDVPARLQRRRDEQQHARRLGKEALHAKSLPNPRLRRQGFLRKIGCNLFGFKGCPKMSNPLKSEV